MSDTDTSTDTDFTPEQIPEDQAKDLSTLQGYLRLKEHLACQIEKVYLFDPNGANVNVLQYLDTTAVLSLQPIEVYGVTSDTQLAQLLQTRSNIAYSVLKIGGLQAPVLVCRPVAAPAAAPTATPAPDVQAQPQAGPKIKLQALGAETPIRGNFDITAEQISALCTGKLEPYGLYADAIAQDSAKYGLNPLFVLADFINQGVYAPYHNPWGISTDYYPYGPNGTQLGQRNGKVPNGPRKFGLDEWRIAFDRQFGLVASKNGTYKNANTIAQWAAIDAPPGAENDVHGTNAQEAQDVGAIYNRLVKAL